MNTLAKQRWSSGRQLFICAVLCALIGMPLSMVAQQYAGSITGTVTDSSGAAVPQAAVTVVNTGTNATYNATTSDQGVYNFSQVPVGVYEVHVKVANFKEYIATEAVVHVPMQALLAGVHEEKSDGKPDHVPLRSLS